MNTYPSIKQGFGIIGIFLIGTLIAAGISIGIKPFVDDEFSFFITYVISVGGTFLIVNAIRKSKTSISTFNFEVEDRSIIPFIIIVAIAIPYGITAPLTSLIPMNDFVKEIVMKVMAYNGFWAFLTIVIVGPILEELIFRGIILDGFLKQYSAAKSILMSSVLFGIFHMNPWQFITAMVLGTFIGWVYHRTRSLTVAILIHITNNLIASVGMMFSDITIETMDETIIEMYGGILPFISVTLVSLIIIVYGIYLLNNKMDPAPKPIPAPLATIHESTPSGNIP